MPPETYSTTVVSGRSAHLGGLKRALKGPASTETKRGDSRDRLRSSRRGKRSRKGVGPSGGTRAGETRTPRQSQTPVVETATEPHALVPHKPVTLRLETAGAIDRARDAKGDRWDLNPPVTYESLTGNSQEKGQLDYGSRTM